MILLKDIKEYRDKVRSAQFEAGAKMFMDRIFSNLEEKLFDKHPNLIFYKFDNEIIAEYDKINKYFFYDYCKIYRVLQKELGFNDIKIKELIVSKVEEHLKFKMVKPIFDSLKFRIRIIKN